MADELFDSTAATERLKRVLYKVEDIRNMMNKEIINYYADSRPDSAEIEERDRAAIRKYLRFAVQDIDALLDGELRN